MKELRIGNKDLIKDINIYLVLNEIRKNSPISRAEISKNTGLAQSTITNIVNQLIKYSLVTIIGDGESTGGRKPIKLALNYNYGFSIAIKVETNHFIFSLCDLEPKIVETRSVSFPKNSPYDEVDELFMDALTEVYEEANKKNNTILGIGVTLSGIVDKNKDSQVNSSLLGWYDFDIKERIEKRFNVDVVVENDVNCFTQYHNDKGLGKDLSNFICITVGEGIGSGIIINEELYRGYFGGAGEFGHQIIHPEGKNCYCGQKGCLEMYSSEDALIKEIDELTGQSYSYEDIFVKNKISEDVVLQALNKTFKHLSYGIINLIMQLNPQEIILGLKSELYQYDILSIINKYVEENWFNIRGHINTSVRISELTDDRFILGVASMVVEEIMKNPVFIGYKSLL